MNVKDVNGSINLIAFALVILALAFVALGQTQIAGNLVSGALALLAGKSLREENNNGPKVQ